jgi:PX domain
LFKKIPSLPTKKLNSNEADTVRYRQQSFDDFLNFVVKHDKLVYSPEFLAFLKLPDPEFEKFKDVLSIYSEKRVGSFHSRSG